MTNEKETQKIDTVDTQLELLKYATQVQSRIKTDITSDFTLAKLTPEDKQGITNMTVNAYTAKRKILNIKQKSYWYQWTGTHWIKTQPTTKTEQIQQIANKTFDTYMTKVQMTTILNRNTENNHLLELLKNQPQTTPIQEEEPTTEKKLKDKIIKPKTQQ